VNQIVGLNMILFSFIIHFRTESDCRAHFKRERDKLGAVCKCGSWETECSNYGWATSLKGVQTRKKREARTLF